MTLAEKIMNFDSKYKMLFIGDAKGNGMNPYTLIVSGDKMVDVKNLKADQEVTIFVIWRLYLPAGGTFILGNSVKCQVQKCTASSTHNLTRIDVKVLSV